MSITLGKAVLYLAGDDTQLNQHLSGVEGKTRSVLGRIGGFASNAFSFAVGGLITQGINRIAGEFGNMVNAAMEAQQIGAQTAAVIASTGQAAGMTADSVAELAESLSNVTTFEDDAIQAGENILLTFTNIGKDVFPAVTETMLDMSQALGQDMKSSAMQLGKALNDPIKGMTALTRVGVTFTEEQKAQIKAMQEAGDVAGAQKVILAELSREFGGSAQAAGQTFAGQLQIVQNQLGNLKESIGTALLPVLSQFLGFLTSPAVMNAVKGLVEGLAAGLGQVGIILGALVGDIQPLGDMLRSAFGSEVANVVTDIVLAVRMLIESLAAGSLEPLQGFIENVGFSTPLIGEFVTRIGELVAWFRERLPAAIQVVTEHWQRMVSIWLGVAQAVFPAIRAIVETVLGAIRDFLAKHGEEIQNLLGKAWRTIAMGIDLAVKLINATIVPVFKAIAKFISDHQAEITAVIETAWKIISAVIETALTVIQGIIAALTAAIEGDWRKFGEILRSVWEALWTRIKNIVTDVDWVEVGKSIIRGIGSGMSALGNWLADRARDIARGAMDAIKGFFGIRSPSSLMAREVGRPMVQGIAQGFEQAMGTLRDSMRVDFGNLGFGMQPAYAMAGATINITVNAPGGDGASIARTIRQELTGLQAAKNRGY